MKPLITIKYRLLIVACMAALVVAAPASDIICQKNIVAQTFSVLPAESFVRLIKSIMPEVSDRTQKG
jgi:hypothetical protein